MKRNRNRKRVSKQQKTIEKIVAKTLMKKAESKIADASGSQASITATSEAAIPFVPAIYSVNASSASNTQPDLCRDGNQISLKLWRLKVALSTLHDCIVRCIVVEFPDKVSSSDTDGALYYFNNSMSITKQLPRKTTEKYLIHKDFTFVMDTERNSKKYFDMKITPRYKSVEYNGHLNTDYTRGTCLSVYFYTDNTNASSLSMTYDYRMSWKDV